MGKYKKVQMENPHKFDYFPITILSFCQKCLARLLKMQLKNRSSSFQIDHFIAMLNKIYHFRKKYVV